MSICLQSLRSSSAGNCLALWTPTSSVLIDCGVSVQRDCVALLNRHGREAGNLDGVVVSHKHRDHMAYGALRVLAREGIPVYGHASVLRQLREQHDPQAWKVAPELRVISDGPTRVGDFHLTPIAIPHAPGVPTFGFRIQARDRGATHSIVVCTDLYDYAAVVPYLAGADIIFVEANHDLALLRTHPNPNSHYHLNNVKTASLLHHVASGSAAPPKAVMLGHLSEQRNRRSLAIGEVKSMFERQGTKMRFHLDAAPAHTPSPVIEI